MRDTVIFDLGGVLIDWNPRHLFRKLFDDEQAMEHFLGHVCTPEWHLQHDAGKQFAETRDELRQRYPEHAALIDAFGDRHSEMMAGAIEGSVVLLERLAAANVPLFAITGAWSAFMWWWRPEVVLGDLRIFSELLHGESGILALLIIAVGAPLSEELLFRGFLFSGLAKSRLGLIGTSVLTAVLWTTLHYGYSIFGLLEVLAIGLYFSWLLVRTGSLWAPIFSHAVYNTVIGLVLYFVTLPPPA